MPTPDRVWVWEETMASYIPKIEEYPLVAAYPTYHKIVCRGGTKMMRNALGRKFYTDLEELKKDLERWLTRRAESLARQRVECLEHLKSLAVDPYFFIHVIPPAIPIPTPSGG